MISIKHALKSEHDIEESNQLISLELRIKSIEYIHEPGLYSALFSGQFRDIPLPPELEELVQPIPGSVNVSESEVRSFLRNVIDIELGLDVFPVSVGQLAVRYIHLYEKMKEIGIIMSSIPISREHIEQLFHGHYSSIHLLEVESVFDNISTRLPEFYDETAEIRSILSHLKRGCLCSNLVGRLTPLLVRHGPLEGELLEYIRVLNYLLIYIDLLDTLSVRFSRQGSMVLRNLNIKSFCSSLSKRILCLMTVSKFEFDHSNSQIRRLAQDSHSRSPQRVLTLLNDVLKKCEDLVPDNLTALTETVRQGMIVQPFWN
jgi:hypothetical protein